MSVVALDMFRFIVERVPTDEEIGREKESYRARYGKVATKHLCGACVPSLTFLTRNSFIHKSKSQ